MKKIFSILVLLVSFEVAIAQTQTYLTPTTVPATYEQFNSNRGIRSTWGSGFSWSRSVVKFTQTITSGESVSFDISNVNNAYFIGLTTSSVQTDLANDPVGNTNIPFGMKMGAEGTAQAYESGVTAGSSTTLTAGNLIRISFTGGAILYQKSTNGVDYTTFHTSGTTPSGTYTIYLESPPQGAGPDNIYKTGTAVNQPPAVTAPADFGVTLPISETTLNGLATDADGTLSTILWTKISGPSGGSFVTSGNDTSQVTGLMEGVYVFRLTAIDDDGASTSDDVTVTVAPADPNGTVYITPTIIPLSDPEVESHGRGMEDWNLQNYVMPVEGVQSERKDLYFRWGWYEIETAQNVFNWDEFDGMIELAISKGQTFSFGIMSTVGVTGSGAGGWHSGVAAPYTGGAWMNYPLYLHNLMQAESPQTDYIRGNEWLPNYNSPSFLARTKILCDSINAHIQAGSYNGVNYKDVINYVDIRHYGAWGEWHQSIYHPDTTSYPSGRQPTVASLDSIISYYVRGFPNYKTIVNVAAFDARWFANTWIPPAVTYFALTQRNNAGPVGWRRDNWGNAYTDQQQIHNWVELNTRSYGGMTFKDTITERWKYAPVVGEPPGYPSGTTPDLKDIPKEVRFYHASSFGNGNMYTVPMYTPANLSTGTKDSVRQGSKEAGYRIQIEAGAMSSVAYAGGNLNISLSWRNAGIAPVYDKYLPVFQIKNSAGTVVHSDTSSFRPYLYLPSTTVQTVTDVIAIPDNIPNGTYSVSLIIRDSLGYRSPLALAIQGRQADGSYVLRSGITISQTGANLPPSVNISGTPYIILPVDEDTLTASASDPDGTISTYVWTQVSGPTAASIISSTSASTRITDLTAGTFIFQVLITDNGGLTSIATATITVEAANTAPVANAGGNVLVRTPTTTTYLNGAGTDTDGTISTYAWTKISGPSGGSITTPTSQVTQITGLGVGSYVFRLTVTDNDGATSTSDATVTVTVSPAPRKRIYTRVN
jgi:hypothetical protein